VRSGGVAGARLSTTVESAELTAEDHQKLRSLVEASGLAATPPAYGPRPPDRLQYHLSVDDDGRKIDLRLGEEEVPEALRPLLDWLTDRARAGLRRA
jgi:Emfourin